jgi:hypothetical protein
MASLLALMSASGNSKPKEPNQVDSIGTANPGVANQNLFLMRGKTISGVTNNSNIKSNWNSSPSTGLTVVGSPAQGWFEPTSNNWSIANYGNSSLTSAVATQLNVSNSAYTIEYWVNIPAPTYVGDIVSFWGYGYWIGYETSGNGGYSAVAACQSSYYKVGLVYGNSGGTVSASNILSPQLNYGQWYHICIMRSGALQYGYVNGVYTGSTYSEGSSAVNYQPSTYSSAQFYMNDGNYGMVNGIVSNIRVSLTNLYSLGSNFTVPTSPLTDGGTNTKFLTAQDGWVCDQGNYDYSFNVYNSVTSNNSNYLFNYGPFASSNKSASLGSVYLSGTDGFYDNSTGGNADGGAVQVTSSGFFISAWIYPTTFNGTSSIVSNWGSTTATQGFALGYNSSGTLTYQQCVGSTFTSISANGDYNLIPNQWNFVLFNRNINTGYFFVNGIAAGSGGITGSSNNTGNDLLIGAPNANAGWNGVTGYIAEFQYNASSVKTSAFSTAADISAYVGVTNPSSQGFSVSPIDFFNFSNGSVLDYAYSSSIYLTGSCGTSNAQQKFTSIPSVYYDGVGQSYMIPPANGGIFFNWFTTFTIEGWFYLTENAGTIGLFGSKASSTQYAPIELTYSGGYLTLSNGSATTTLNSSITAFETMPLNTWCHIAVVRNGAYMALYLNGQQQGVTGYSAYNSAIPEFYIGGNMTTYSSGYSPFSGYIQEFRVSSTNQYSGASFTVPTTTFTTT